MAKPIWVTPAGFLGTYTERTTISIPVVATGTNLSYSLISGNLPLGLALQSATGNILGTPVSVPSNVSNEFVVRVSNGDGLSDRTFNLDVTGPSTPIWATATGSLPVGLNGEFYAFNKEYVDYKLRAETDILAPGNTLKYYISDQQGQLPPGLKLSTSGRIYGYIEDTLKIDSEASLSGGYDTEVYDRYPYDHGIIINNVVELVRPESISKIYQFYVTVTDGIASSRRLFSIQVVDPNSLRADNTFILTSDNEYDASSGYLLPPIWQTQFGELLPEIANLGTIRASRKQVITLHEYDPYPFVGPISWDWNLSVNPELRILTDSQFNNAGFETRNLAGATAIYVKDTPLLPLKGMKIRIDETLSGFDSTLYTITGVIKTGADSGVINIDRPLTKKIPDTSIIYVGSPSIHPPGLNLDTQSGELYGTIPYQPAYSQTYKFTIRIIKTDIQTGLTVSSSQIFLLTIKGDIESYINFVSTGSLGVLVPGQISEIAVVAENINSDYNIQYDLVSGQLPRGLSLNTDGTIEGRIEYKTQTYFDLTSSTQFLIDGGSTTIDKNWYFTVRASDVYKLSAIEQQFYITVNEESFTEYTRIFVKPFMHPSKREEYQNFTTDEVIFDLNIIYRPFDPEFGVQPEIKMAIETGIEKVDIEKYVDAMSTYFYRKRFYFGDIKSVTAQDANGNDVYELVYADIVDDQMLGIYSPPYSISVENMQEQLEGIEVSAGVPISVDEYLRPRFMSTIQKDTGAPLGFIKCVPICYVLPGNSDKVLSRIKSSGFDFKNLDFDTDRIIVETPKEDTENGWLFYPTGRR
jgi:hypothetical protein